ncbi:MAG: hypothetical protein JXB50_17005 [Spirochaetes bacterium]|nr:hypothetical protein [Spirochaetota bacterium]
MKKKPFRTRQEITESIANYGETTRMLTKIAVRFISVGGIVIICYFFAAVLKSYAGKTTIANIVFNFLADIKLDKVIAYIFGAGGIGYGLKERQLRKKNIERYYNQKDKLEKIINPDKQTSSLTKNGNTNKEDL